MDEVQASAIRHIIKECIEKEEALRFRIDNLKLDNEVKDILNDMLELQHTLRLLAIATI